MALRLPSAVLLLLLGLPLHAHAECMAPRYGLSLLTPTDAPIPRGSFLVVTMRQTVRGDGTVVEVPGALHLESGAMRVTLEGEAIVGRTVARYAIPTSIAPGQWHIAELGQREILISSQGLRAALGAPHAVEIVWGRTGPSVAVLQGAVPARAALVIARFTDGGDNEHVALNAVRPGVTRPVVWEPRPGRCAFPAPGLGAPRYVGRAARVQWIDCYGQLSPPSDAVPIRDPAAR